MFLSKNESLLLPVMTNSPKEEAFFTRNHPPPHHHRIEDEANFPDQSEKNCDHHFHHHPSHQLNQQQQQHENNFIDRRGTTKEFKPNQNGCHLYNTTITAFSTTTIIPETTLIKTNRIITKQNSRNSEICLSTRYLVSSLFISSLITLSPSTVFMIIALLVSNLLTFRFKNEMMSFLNRMKLFILSSINYYYYYQYIIRKRRREKQKVSTNYPHQNNMNSNHLWLFLILYLIQIILSCPKLALHGNFFITAHAQEIINDLDFNIDKQIDTINNINNNNQEAPNFYANPPEALVAHEFGSGDGPNFNSRNQNGRNNLKIPHHSSSSITPSLITAKCYNNYQDDNDCKNLNVITANQAPDGGRTHNDDSQDDSIITQVVIFESSSTIDPSLLIQQQLPVSNDPSTNNNNYNNDYPSPSLMAPPYFASTFRPDGGSSSSSGVVLTRHRKPPTANDVYAAPPAGATIIPTELSYQQQQQNVIFKFHPSLTTTTTTKSPKPSDMVTWPTTSEFVATPQPKKPPKTTTMGRKCRDENDEDCDEPDEPNGEESKRVDNESSPDDGDDGGDDDETSSSESRNILRDKSKSISASRGRPDDDTTNEIGSGDHGFDDDNEDDGDADDDSLEMSGVSEMPSEHITRLVTVETVKSTIEKVTNNNNNINQPYERTSSSSSPSIVVDVEVHPTLPASFPITTTEANQVTYANNNNNKYNQQQQQDTTTLLSSSTSSTVMPDDTYRAQPVFPTTTPPSDEGSSSQEFTNEPATTTELSKDELSSFIPIPMPDGIGQWRSRNPSGSGSSFNNATLSGNLANTLDSSGLSDRNKFDPASFGSSPVSSTTPRSFEAPWISRKPMNTFNEQWRQQQERARAGRLPSGSDHLGAGASSSTSNGPTAPSGNQMMQQREMLPALLLYACIIILSVTAVIFIIIATIFYRRNNARHRALLRHKANMMNGAGGGGMPPNVGSALGQHQMIGSMSQGSQLLANIQQPGLLSTYAPVGKGLSETMGKVTSSLVKQSSSQDNMIIPEEDEDRLGMSLDGEQQQQQQLVGRMHANQLKDTLGGDGSLMGDQVSPSNSNGNQNRQARDGSWTTEDQTTSSGSQKTSDSQLNGTNNFNSNTMQGGQSRQAYPNSLSDGRQNSSSISDSQCSPDNFSHNEQSQARPPAQASHPQYLPQAAPIPLYAHQQQQQQQQAMYNSMTSTPPLNHLHNQQQSYQQQMIPRAQLQTARYGANPNSTAMMLENNKKPFISSRSVENLRMAQNGLFNPDQRLAHYPVIPSTNFHPQQPMSAAMGNLGAQQQISPFHKPNQPVAFAPNNNNNLIQRPYSRASLMNPTLGGNGAQSEVFLQNGNNSNFNQPLMVGPAGPEQHPMQPPYNVNELHLNSPIHPARVAMNPLATLSRRHPGLGLNRNIYSEDSSSLLTASPSLARTSSSLSFATSTSQAPTLIRGGKPQLDGNGRPAYNDYIPGSPFSNSNGHSASAVSRNERPEPWFL